jgi:hypothetical protein
MAGSRDRPRWDHLPAVVRAGIEALVGASVVAAENYLGWLLAGGLRHG